MKKNFVLFVATVIALFVFSTATLAQTQKIESLTVKDMKIENLTINRTGSGSSSSSGVSTKKITSLINNNATVKTAAETAKRAEGKIDLLTKEIGDGKDVARKSEVKKVNDEVELLDKNATQTLNDHADRLDEVEKSASSSSWAFGIAIVAAILALLALIVALTRASRGHEHDDYATANHSHDNRYAFANHVHSIQDEDENESPVFTSGPQAPPPPPAQEDDDNQPPAQNP